MKLEDPRVPFGGLPLLPPKTGIETGRTLKKAVSTARALANLNGKMMALPNPNLLLDTIYLREAKASSEVENIVTTNDELYREMVAEMKTENPAAKEVLRYKDALWLGLSQLESRPFIDTNLCIRIVQCIKRNDASIRNIPGTVLKNARGEVVYTPPTGEALIRDRLANWENYVNDDSDGVEPLLKMAVMHYQFEAIHPFADGNGRTGRILMLLYLKLTGLLDTPALYLSEYILSDKSRYYGSIRNVTEKGDWEGFILYILDMVEKTSVDGTDRLGRIVAAMDGMDADMRKSLPKIHSRTLVEILFKLPYVKRRNLIDEGIGNAKTVGKYLMALEEKGFLGSVRVGKEKLYINRILLGILEDRRAY
jgi:Fic family protein